MNGFFGTYGDVHWQWELPEKRERQEVRSAIIGRVNLTQFTLPKFAGDKVWFEREGVFFAAEGVILNLDELRAQYDADDNESLFFRLYNQSGDTFFSLFRGSFCGVVCDTAREICLVYNDQTGSRPLFWGDCCGLFWASDLHVLKRALTEHGVEADRDFAAAMLSFGYSPLCGSPLKGVRRLGAGECLKIEKGKAETLKYHRFSHTQIDISEIEAVKRTDLLFRAAVERILRKNKEYNLENIMPLSAGLDSRMTVWVAAAIQREKGEETGIKNITYSQTGYFDDTVPHDISRVLGTDMHFTALDGGDYLKEIKAAVADTCGLVVYSGAAQVKAATDSFAHQKIGVIATGMIGDIVLNANEPSASQPFFFGDGALSGKCLSLMPPEAVERLQSAYPDKEIYYLYTRGFNCANLGAPLVFQNFAESYSPFCDVDFLQFALSVPNRMRYNYRLYDKWILSCYPEAAAWLHNGEERIGRRHLQVTIAGRTMPLRDVPKRIAMSALKRAGITDLYALRKGASMNPLDAWLEDNAGLREEWESFYVSNRGCLAQWHDIDNAAEKLFRHGTAAEKTQVLTLLASLTL